MLATWTKKFRCWRVPITFCTSLPTRCFLSLNSEKLFSCVLVMDCHCHFIVLYSSLENNKKQKQWNWPKEGRKIVGKFVGIWPPDTKLNLVVLKLRTHVQVEDWLHTYTFPVPLRKKSYESSIHQLSINIMKFIWRGFHLLLPSKEGLLWLCSVTILLVPQQILPDCFTN